MKSFRSVMAIPFLAFCIPWSLSGQAQTEGMYKKGWIDLNKNGQKDTYEDPSRPVETRVEDLLSRMTIEEKTCQMVTLYGYQRVLRDSLPTPEWKNKLWKDGMGAIDEHLNGFRHETIPSSNHPYTWPASKHAWALNAAQRFFVEETRLGIPVDFTDEGIRGVEAHRATDFPTPIGIGSTWDRDLVREIGRITAQEARALGFTNVYAPILDLARDPRWGRVEEVYGEEPYHAGRLGVEMTGGMQEDHLVTSTAKHYAVYGTPKGGREGFSRTDPQFPLREVHQIHLWPFRTVIEEAGLLGVMSSYNDYDGIPVSGSRYFLIDLLRKEYGFQGYVVSDSDALEYLYTKHRVASSPKEAVRQAVEAGMNVRCTFAPPETMVLPLRELVREGRLSVTTIDERVRDILRVKFLAGLFDRPYVEDLEASDRIVLHPEHQKTALRASQESLVLLKNEGRLLPLAKTVKKVAVIGPNADDGFYARRHYGPGNPDVVTVLAGIKAKLGKSSIVSYAKGCDSVDEGWPDSELWAEPLSDREKFRIAEAVDQARTADVAVLVLGDSPETCGENRSRTDLNLPGRQEDLLRAVYATDTPIILVLINGRPLTINWANINIPAILEAWFPGSKGGTAVADVLFGDACPGGKLSITFPKSVGQIPLNFPCKPQSNSEGIRHRAGVDGPLYPFGFGLSYTTFEYSGLEISPSKQQPQANVSVSFDVENTGSVEGDEIVQLYIQDKVSSVTTYEKNLRGFERIRLKPGEKKRVTFALGPKDLALLDRHMEWTVEPGTFRVMAGASSEDIRLEGEFEIVDSKE
jgi:beta-glucosidase